MGNYELYDPIIRYDDIHTRTYDENITKIFEDNLNEFSKHFENAEYYAFDGEHYDNLEYESFKRKIEAILKLNPEKSSLYVVSGKAGTGKTTFLKKHLPKMISIKDNNYDVNDLILIINFRNKEEDHNIEFYERKIFLKVCDHVLDRVKTRFHNDFKNFVRKIMKDSNINPFTELDKEILSKLAISYYMTKIPEKTNYQMLIIIDNIDLCSKTTQNNVAKAASNVYEEIINLSKAYTLPPFSFHIIIVKRPETKINDEVGNYEDPIKFPDPNVGLIFINSFCAYLESVVDNRVFEDVVIDFYDYRGEIKRIKNAADLAKYIKHYIYDIWKESWNGHIVERFGSFNEFHIKLVNYNLRRFMRFMAYTIKNGGLDIINPKKYNNQNRYNVHDYIRMLISGSYEFHIGNKYMDGEGYLRTAPIVMNIFDYSTIGRDREEIISNYLIYLRIIQFLEIMKIEGHDIVTLTNLLKELTDFFTEESLITAIKKLLFADVISELFSGVRNLQYKDSWMNIELKPEDYSKIQFSTDGSSTSGFYYKNLVVEYEYLFQMSVSTPLFVSDEDKEFVTKMISLPHSDREKFIHDNREKIVFLFIKSIYYTIIENNNKYKKNGMYDHYRRLFCPDYISDKDIKHPWRRMASNFISVMGYKQLSFMRNSNYTKAVEMEKLSNQCSEFKEKAEKIFHKYDERI